MDNGRKSGDYSSETDNLHFEKYESGEKFFESLFNYYDDVKVPRNQEDYSLKKSIEVLANDLNDLDIAGFCNGNDVSPTVLLMSATLLTLDKFTYSPNSLLTNIFNGKNNSYDILKGSFQELPIVVDRKDRNQCIKSLLTNVGDCWNDVLKHCLFPTDKLFSDRNITATIAYGYFEDFSKEEMEKTVKKLDDENRDLQICFIRNDDDFSAYLSYNSGLYTSNYMDVFLSSLKTIIDKIMSLDIENHPIKDISLMDVKMGENSSIEIPTLVELFERQVSETPSKTALIVNGEEISYDELNQNANRIANGLLGKLDSKSNIVILLPRSKELMYSIWGVLKAGCSFIPLDGSYPEDRIEFIIEDSASSLIITDRDMPKAVSPQALLDNDNIDNPDINIGGDDVAYMLYTSGTTGVPKGVYVSHKNFANVLMPEGNMLYNAVTDDVDRVLTLTAVNYTPSIKDFCLALTSGLTLVYANNDEIDNINSLIDLIEKYKPQLIGSITPSRLTELLNVTRFEKTFKHIEKVILLGEKFPPSLYPKIKSKNSLTRVFNEYGSTEALLIGFSEIVGGENIVLGFANPTIERYIMDIDEKVLPAGIQGQLYISGPSITLGYSNEELNTAYVNIDDKRLFKTGDLAYSLGNGEIALLGRVDKQLKLRGQRLEPDEITAIINKFENISNSVITLNEINGLQHLIAYYVSDVEINEEGLKTYLESKLQCMVPSQFIRIPEIPTNLNGKLDVGKLPEPSFGDVDYEAPTNEKEELVVSAFEELFNKKIGINDDFILLGGTSLSAMRILSCLSGYSITTADLLQLRTPKKLAAQLQEINIDQDRYGFDDNVPLSASQLNVYLDEVVNDMGTGYNNSFEVEFKDNYSVEDIKDALIKLFDAYPVLKARIMSPKEKLPYCVFDAKAEIEEGMPDDVEFFVRPFELDKNLSRFLIVEDGQSISLYMDIHHLIFDGTSLNNILNTLFSILNDGNVDFIDNGILRQISFEENMDSQYMDEAHEFYDVMLADRDEIYELLPCRDVDDEFEYVDTFDMDDRCLSSFLQNNEITLIFLHAEVLFTLPILTKQRYMKTLIQ